MQVKKEEKYRLILKAAMETIMEKGFEKTSISEIVKRAGVAHGTFYLYFPSKSAIVPAIAELLFDELLEEIKTRSANDNSIWDTFHNMIDVSFDMTEKHKDVLIFCYSGLAFYHSFDRWEEIYLSYYRWLEGKLQHAYDNKEISLRPEYGNIVKMIINIMETTAENYYFSIEQTNEKEITKMKEDVFLFIKKALQ